MPDKETITRLRAERNALKAHLHSVLCFLRGYSPHAVEHFASAYELVGLSTETGEEAKP